MGFFGPKDVMPTAETALPGRSQPMPIAKAHFVTGQPLDGPFEGAERI
ncbi:MAG TPA: peptide-methionine (S)-S-oxide reductase, partial [Deltaproteobacteria bacterium]|nr:peptide-methionine (S)-S-oxide reductase [Deltaproteobacteria bacterium]